MTNPNDPAYPVSILANVDGITTEIVYRGLTKREEFARSAMQGLMDHFVYNYKVDVGKLAEQAVMMADALLNELNKPVTQ